MLISNGDKQMAKLANQAGHARNRADKHMQRPLSHHDSIQLVHRSGSQCPIVLLIHNHKTILIATS